MIRRIAQSVGLLAAMASLALPASAAASGPAWKLTVMPDATYFFPGHYGSFFVIAENVGTASTDGTTIGIEDLLPSGFAAENVKFSRVSASPPGVTNLGGLGLCSNFTECEYPGSLPSPPPIQPGDRLVMVVSTATPNTTGSRLDRARVFGGGAPGAEASATVQLNADPPLSSPSFSAALSAEGGEAVTQAGSHPSQFSTEFDFPTYSFDSKDKEGGGEFATKADPVHDPRQIASDLPPGLVADPQAVPTCSLADFFAEACPRKDAVGTGSISIFSHPESRFTHIEPIYNLQPTGAYPGELGLLVASAPFTLITASVRSGSDYGITAATTGAPETGLTHVRVNLWGVPADASHDSLRAKECQRNGTEQKEYQWSAVAIERQCALSTQSSSGLSGGDAEGTPPTPFITLPTACTSEPLSMNGRYDTWDFLGQFQSATTQLSEVNGCGQLRFEPTIEARPTTNLSDAPSGLEFDLHIPQHCWEAEESPNFEALCQADLHEAVVKLPPGLTLNPSSGNGLTGCLPAEIGLETAVGQTPAHFSESPAACPEQSAVGTAEVKTPLLHNPLHGVVYLATPHQNPFDSLLAGYLVLEGEGLIIKLPGRIEADPQTGQITGRFLENPQTPFEDFHLKFFGGARGDLRTPATCGTYTTTSVLTPYSAPESGPPAEPAASFGLDNGGASCPHQPSEQPNAPVFRAGTESPQAGAFTPFSFRLAREDGSQEIEKIETTLPPGLTGKLAGLAECSEAQIAAARSREHEGGGAEEKANPSCPASSEVGEVEVASGAGPTPLYVSGHAYLAGPYKGAPLSLAIVTPAVAGPFDLGTVVVRTALYTAPYTAQIKAVSDPIPHILQGIPLDVRSITLRMSRPNFTLNPTNCEEMGFAGTETSLLGNVAPLSQRFQVGGCQGLPFKPKLKISLKGGIKRHTFPALTATLTMPPGQANIAKAQVTLPHSEQLEQGHITSQVCLQAQLATRTCPPASVYGYAKAETPLLDHPLEGPVYLGVGFGHELPDLVAELNGQIRVLLHGKVDTGREDGLRNTFEVVPDAPVSKFTLHMFGGRKSLIVNSQNLCAPRTKRKALARFAAQNGKVVEVEPTVATSCKKHGKSKAGSKPRRGRIKRARG
jgi:hypothetical protein